MKFFLDLIKNPHFLALLEYLYAQLFPSDSDGRITFGADGLTEAFVRAHCPAVLELDADLAAAGDGTMQDRAWLRDVIVWAAQHQAELLALIELIRKLIPTK